MRLLCNCLAGCLLGFFFILFSSSVAFAVSPGAASVLEHSKHDGLPNDVYSNERKGTIGGDVTAAVPDFEQVAADLPYPSEGVEQVEIQQVRRSRPSKGGGKIIVGSHGFGFGCVLSRDVREGEMIIIPADCQADQPADDETAHWAISPDEVQERGFKD